MSGRSGGSCCQDSLPILTYATTIEIEVLTAWVQVPIEVIYGTDDVVGLRAGRVSFASDSKYAHGLPSFGLRSDKPNYASLGMLIQADEEVFPLDTLYYISRSPG